MEADRHPREHERLDALHDLGVLDEPSAPEFDQLVSLVARICDVPVALISLVDDTRQWFMAETGLGMCQTPRSQSICAHAILDGAFFEIPDTQADIRTADNPLCQGPDGFRYYGGVPLLADDGLPLGTLCVLDRRPRQLDALQRETLTVMAGQAARLIELRRLLSLETVLRDEIDHRVKNSLQSVLSIMRLYRMRLSDRDALEAFEAVQRRIEAVAALHEALYKHGDGGDVRLHEYLSMVISALQESAPEHVTVSLVMRPMIVASQHAATMAIIVSEFCANAIKHAFPDGRTGSVTVEALRDRDGSITLVCRDNGIGSGGKSIGPVSDAVTLGLRIMEGAALQIGATLDNMPTPEGFVLTLVVPPPRSLSPAASESSAA